MRSCVTVAGCLFHVINAYKPRHLPRTLYNLRTSKNYRKARQVRDPHLFLIVVVIV